MEKTSDTSRRPRRIFLVRHGQSTSSTGLAPAHPALAVLTGRGHAQAAALATGWGTGRLAGAGLEPAPAPVLASHCLRARQTALPLAQHWGRICQTHSLLHEWVRISPAATAGLPGPRRGAMEAAFLERCTAHNDWGACHGSDSESFAAFATRVARARRALHLLAPDSVLFGHGYWMAMLLWQLHGGDGGTCDALLAAHDVALVPMQDFFDFQQRLPMPNCAVYVLTAHPADVHADADGVPRWTAHFVPQAAQHLHHLGLLAADAVFGPA